ncbi:MAG: thioredoxin TrxC [Betaproteobacteria bacterium]
MLLTCPHCAARNRIDPQRLSQSPVCGKCGREIFAGAPLVLDESNFGAVLEGCGRPVVVDFWAAWCGPCRGFAPVFEATAARRPPALLAKVDPDAHPQIAAALAIRSIPTLALYGAGGEPIERMRGALPARAFEAWLAAGLARA